MPDLEPEVVSVICGKVNWRTAGRQENLDLDLDFGGNSGLYEDWDKDWDNL